MTAHRIEATLTEDATLVLHDLPFHAGESVDVIILARPAQRPSGQRYPLHGTPIRYERPADPVAPGDWEVLR